MSRIVVGFGGSNSARQTVAWSREGAEVPSTWGAPAYLPVVPGDPDTLTAIARRAVDGLVSTRESDRRRFRRRSPQPPANELGHHAVCPVRSSTTSRDGNLPLERRSVRLGSPADGHNVG